MSNEVENAARSVAINYCCWLDACDLFDAAQEENGDLVHATRVLFQSRRVVDAHLDDLLDLFPEVRREFKIGAVLSAGMRSPRQPGPAGR